MVIQLWQSMRHTMCRQIGRRRTNVMIAARQTLGNHRAVFQVPQSNGQIIALLNQIKDLVCQCQRHIQPWIGGNEIVDEGGNVIFTKSNRRSDIEFSARALVQVGYCLLRFN